MLELHQELFKTDPGAALKVHQKAVKEIADLRRQVGDKDDEIIAHIRTEGRLQNEKSAEVKRWLTVVKRKNAEKIEVNLAHLGPPDCIAIHPCLQLHNTVSELYRTNAMLERRVANSTNLLNQSYNWTLRQVTAPSHATRHSTRILCS